MDKTPKSIPFLVRECALSLEPFLEVYMIVTAQELLLILLAVGGVFSLLGVAGAVADLWRGIEKAVDWLEGKE